MKAQISLAPDGRLLLEFPRTDVWAEHSVLLEPTIFALKHIVTMLGHQEQLRGKLAQGGAPTQAIVDAWLKQEKKKADAALLRLTDGVDL